MKPASIAVTAGLPTRRGHPLPLGATVRPQGVNFAVYSRHAAGVHLVLFHPGSFEIFSEIPLDPRYNKTGDIWHVLVSGLRAGVEYGWRTFGPSGGPVYRFDPERILIDPFGKALAGAEAWGRDGARPSGVRPRRTIVVDDDFDWGDDHPLNIALADTVIYEMHVRGFTRHPSSGVEHPGTFLGVIEKIPYLVDLGVTAVELMPVTEFDELDNEHVNPVTGEPLLNFWGYHPLNFFAPKASYAVGRIAAAAVHEFKTMVQALHDAGIEVILDMVLNHTAEGDERGPTFCYRGLGNPTYYLIDPRTGAYLNYSGCGNTLNCNHPAVRTMLLEALRYWVTEMHVDGFRFDLASILGRGQDGTPLPNAPILERIAGDPVLANVKLIAEAWDAAGLYQVGTFPSWGRWAEWNGRFRDDVRRFVRGEPETASAVATRLAGSADLYGADGQGPHHSINFVTSHDGFTLADLVSYDQRQNLPNGEDGRDGSPDDLSWNCGVEGPTSAVEINRLRRRQSKNFLALLLLAQGVPMLLAGDEIGRTQKGNNNAYCHDDETSWVDWGGLRAHADLHRFVKILLRYRKAHPILRRRTFFEAPPASAAEIGWHGPTLNRPDWSPESRVLSMHLIGGRHEHDLLLLANMQPERQRFEIPTASAGKRWHRFIDTSLPPPTEIVDDENLVPLDAPRAYEAGPRSSVVLVAR